MNNYKNTIIKNHPDLVGLNLLLIDSNRERIFKTSKDEIVELKFDLDGDLQCNFIKNNKRQKQELSLRKIGIDYLELNDPSVEKILKYLIKPEMEIERIFNNLRYKYLKCIFLSKIKKPSTRIDAYYNKAFQAFMGLKVYQGNVKEKKDNDVFWREAGFTEKARNDISFQIEHEELDFIIKYLRDLGLENYSSVYAELIAIKPGFHELYIHSDFLKIGKEKNKNKTDKIRYTIFKLLRGEGRLESIRLARLNPSEINKKSYLGYAPCNVTKGPFVFRKKLEVSYYDEIREMKDFEKLKVDEKAKPKEIWKLNEKGKRELKKNFHVYDYREEIKRKDLKTILKETEKFKSYLFN